MAVAVNSLGNEFLAGAAFALNEDRGIGGCHLAYVAQHMQQLRVLPNDIGKPVLLVQLAAAGGRLISSVVRVVFLALAKSKHCLNGLQQRIVVPGLGHKLGRPSLHALHCQADAAPASDEDNGHLRSQLFHLAQQGQAIGPGGGKGEIHVHQHEAGRGFAHHG